jgi:hypothetical protein
MLVAIVLIPLAFVHKRQERKHQTIVNLLEKGLPVPRELLGVQRVPGSGLMRAMTLVGAGVGVTAYFIVMFGLQSGLWGAGLIPLAVGVAQLVAIRLEARRPDAAERSTIDLQ